MLPLFDSESLRAAAGLLLPPAVVLSLVAIAVRYFAHLQAVTP